MFLKDSCDTSNNIVLNFYKTIDERNMISNISISAPNEQFLMEMALRENITIF
jgi:hypothetical protein